MTTFAAKSKLLSSVAAISADTTETTLGDSGFFDMRGMEDAKFDFLCTLNTGFSTGSAYFVGEVWGKDTPGGTARLVAVTAEFVVDVAQQIPSEANAPGAVYPRYCQIRWNETGAISSFTATARVRYNRPKIGPSVNHANVTG